MNTISIKINHVALRDFCAILEYAQLHQICTPEQKAVASIMSDLTAKLLKKEIDKRHTTKKFKINLKYYEAFALESTARLIYNNELGGVYANHVALDIANQIHKEL